MNNKKLWYYGTRISQVFAKHSPSNEHKTIQFFPAFDNLNMLEDQYYRSLWYLPFVNNVKVIMMNILGQDDPSNLSCPNYLRKSNKKTFPIEFSKGNVEIEDLKKTDIILVWKASVLKTIPFRYWHQIRIVDPNYYLFSETHTYPGILFHDIYTDDDRLEQRNQSLKRYLNMKSIFSDKYKAYVFGTGPSIEDIDKYSFEENSIRIICNSIVKNKNALRYIKPSILVFTDSVFHFGASRYVEIFLEDVVSAVMEYDIYCVTNEVGGALLTHKVPEISERIITIPAKRFGKPNLLSEKCFYTRDYENVLTRYMLPLAAGLCSEVTLIGFDGRNPDETYFWKHNANYQYLDQMNSVKEAHPAFFRDVEYDEYYVKHCKNLELLCNTIEKDGKTIRVMGNSFIPSFASRLG